MVEVEREPEVVWTFIEYVCVCAGSIARCWGDMPHGDLVFDCVEDIRRRPVEDEKKNYNWKLDDVFYQFVGRGATEVGCPAGKLMISVLARVGGGLWARIRRLSVKVRIRPGMLMPPASQLPYPVLSHTGYTYYSLSSPFYVYPCTCGLTLSHN